MSELIRVVRYRPQFTIGLMLMGGFAAVFEGIGLGFIYPIIQVAQNEGSVEGGGPVLRVFLAAYEFTGVPFTLGYLIVGVALVMLVRYTMSFLVGWLRAILSKQYEGYLRTSAFSRALSAQISYFDREGSDSVLNAIITETRYSGRVITKAVQTMEYVFLIIVYAGVMLYITPLMTALAAVLLGGITFVIRFVLEPAVEIGREVAEANEQVQETAQAGTQGIRDVRLFGLSESMLSTFRSAVQQYENAEIRLRRNRVGITNFYQLVAAITIFVLIYVGFEYTGLTLGELGIFLIAMFQLAPRVSTLNDHFYTLESNISHLARTHEFLDELHDCQEPGGDRPLESVNRIEGKNVRFAYEEDDPVLRGVSFELSRGEFIAFVGRSGAGKSTIVSLLTRMYQPTGGEIRGDGINISEYDLRDWRERIAVVRQNPHIFNTTLERNITISDPSAARAEVERVCEIARVDEFLDELPRGYETELGDDGVRLSGGQRQRIALARALLKDADFLVLDEATSDLDSNLEQEVQSAIESMNREYGILAIAHRLSTVQNADRIHTLSDGLIVESGSHEELLEEDGIYADLYEIQSKGER